MEPQLAAAETQSLPTTAPTMVPWPGGWVIVKRSIVDFFTNIVPWLVGLLAFIPLGLAVLLVLTSSKRGAGANIAALALGIFGVITMIYVGLCWWGSTPVYGLARADGKKMTTREVYTLRGDIVWRLLLANLVLLLPVFVGFLLFIIPGIVLLIWLLPTFVLVPYVIVEDNLGPIDSVKSAYHLSKGHSGKVWGIIGSYLVISLILLIPVLIILVALFHNQVHTTAATTNHATSNSHGSSGSFGGSSPLAAISFAYLYRWIKQQAGTTAEHVNPPVSPVPPVIV